MHHRIRLRGGDELGERIGVGEIDVAPLDVALALFTPALDASLHRRDRDQRRRAAFEVPAATHEIVDGDDLVSLAGEVHRLRPSEIAVSTEHDHRLVKHAKSSWECSYPATFVKKTFLRGYRLGLCQHSSPAGHFRDSARVKRVTILN